MTIDDVIARFLAVWGEPKSDHAEQFIAEYRRSLAGTSPEVLKAAADAVIDNEDYWPRPAAFRRWRLLFQQQQGGGQGEHPAVIL